MVVRCLEDFLLYMDKLGCHKVSGNHTLMYYIPQELGCGQIRILGDLQRWYYISMHYTLHKVPSLTVDLDEKFMTLQVVKHHPSFVPPFYSHFWSDRVTASGFRSFINQKPYFHNDKWHLNNFSWSQNVLVIRQKALGEYLSTIRVMSEANGIDFYILLQEALRGSEFHILSALSSPRLSGHREEAAALLLDSVVYSLFAELIYQAELFCSEVSSHYFSEYERLQIRIACDYLDKNPEASSTIKTLCKMTGLGPQKLQEGFKQFTGTTIAQYRRRIRMEKACRLLTGEQLISEIALAVGYSSPARFSEVFRETYGLLPIQFRKLSRST